MATNSIDPSRLAALLKRVRSEKVPQTQEVSVSSTLPTLPQPTDKYGRVIEYNKEQLDAVTRISNGESIVICGAAGTGKTTVTQGSIQALIQSGRAGILTCDDHKHLVSGTPGVVCISFTRRAVANIKRAMPAGMEQNCLTFHKLLEYEPMYYTVYDEVTCKEKTTMRFEPTRNQLRPLPDSIRVVFIDEASMFSIEFFQELVNALPHGVQFVFLGDIQQLPPVFGSAILGFKMLELHTVELVQVYRQALESPIIRLAHRILSGSVISPTEFNEWKIDSKLTLHPWKKKLSAEVALLTAAKFFTSAIDSSLYNPDEDMILIPFNKSFGTDELNKHIAQHLARKNKKTVYEIIAGFNKVYLSIGEKVLYDKEDAVVVSINPNGSYTGKTPVEASTTLDYWGHDSVRKTEQQEVNLDSVDFLLEQAAASSDEDRVKQASHVVTVRLLDSGQEFHLDAAGEINALLLSYALTVHKSQGSEWRKVFLVLHQSHNTMLQRELLYTGVTRAREELYVICEPESFVKGIQSQRIKGNTLAEKAEFFKGSYAKKFVNGELLQ